jgi:hypothetical protein
LSNWRFMRTVRNFLKIGKNKYWLRQVCPSVSPHAVTRLHLDGFS